MYSTQQLQETLRELRNAPEVTAADVKRAREAMDDAHAAALEAEQAIEAAQRQGRVKRDEIDDLFKKKLDARQIEHDATKIFEDVNRRGGHLVALEQMKQKEAEGQEYDYVTGEPIEKGKRSTTDDEAMLRKLRASGRYSPWSV